MGAILEKCKDKDSVVNKDADYKVPIEDEDNSLQSLFQNLSDQINSTENDLNGISYFNANQKIKGSEKIEKTINSVSEKCNLKSNPESKKVSKFKPKSIQKSNISDVKSSKPKSKSKSKILDVKSKPKTISPIRSKNKSNPPIRKKQKSNDDILQQSSISLSNFSFGEKDLLDDSNKYPKKNNTLNGKLKYLTSEFKRKRNEKNLISLKKFQEKLSSNELIRKDFRLQMLDEINLIRTNRLSYCNKIKSFMKFIGNYSDEKYLNFFDEYNEFLNFRVLRGVPEFEETINFLKNFEKKLIEKKLKIKKLIHIDDLKIPFPEFDINLAKDSGYIKTNFEILKNKLKGKYEVTHYHYDITYKDAEISTLMQVVDDNYGDKLRQKNILRRSTKYVGINYGKISDNLIVVYLVFAN